MAKKKPPHPHPDKLELYEKLLGTHPEIERKGAANPYTSVNGHMFSFLDKEGKVSLRFSKEDQEAFIKKFKTTHSIQHGRVMNGYAIIPDNLLTNTKKLSVYLEDSYEFACALKPKPTKKKK